MDWNKIWQDIVNFFTNNWWNICLFFIVLIFGWLVVKIVLAILRKILSKTRMERIAQNFLMTAIKFLLGLALVLVLLSIIGIEITGILTAVSALILAVGIALESNMANLANGIIIVSNHMFKKGDYIIVDGVEGNITEINFLFTTLQTTDNKKITIPNSDIVNSPVVNLGANAKRRVEFTFSVAYESDVELVKKVVVNVMKSDGRVYLDPEPFCRLKTMNASSLDFFANCWCDNEDYWNVYYYVMEWVYNEFKRNNISVPFNQLEVRDRKDKPQNIVIGKSLPKRVEKERAKEREHSILLPLMKDITLNKKEKKEKAEQKKKNANVKKDKTKTVKKTNQKTKNKKSK